MDNKTFREEVYKKYNYYKNIDNDEFYNKLQYKKAHSTFSTKAIVKNVACLILFCILTTGIVYATSYCIKSIWKEPEQYNYEEEKKITEENIEKSITEEDAKEIGINKLKQLNVEIGNVKESHLNKEPMINKIEWVIITENNLEIKINAKNGELYSFYDNSLLNKISETKMNKKEATEVANEIYEKLEFNKKYELSDILYIGSGKWQAEFAVKYNDIFNQYQSIKITFIAETKKIAMLNVFDYEFEDNPFEIQKEDAINIAKNKYGEEKIESISAKKDIQKMNSIIYQKERNLETGEYRTENIVRNVWNVKIVEKEHGFVENYYVDATTGEIIGGDQVK